MSRKIDPTSDDIELYVLKSLETGNLNWQELAHLDFQELIDRARNRRPNVSDLDWDLSDSSD